MSEDNNEANTAPEVKKTAADHYANFITKQQSHNSLFDTRNTKPVDKDDVARSTGKIPSK